MRHRSPQLVSSKPGQEPEVARQLVHLYYYDDPRRTIDLSSTLSQRLRAQANLLLSKSDRPSERIHDPERIDDETPLQRSRIPAALTAPSRGAHGRNHRPPPSFALRVRWIVSPS